MTRYAEVPIAWTVSGGGGRSGTAIIPGAKLFAHEDHPEDFAASARPFLAATLM